MAQSSSYAVQNGKRDRANRLRFRKRLNASATLILAVMGPVMALATFMVLGPMDLASTSPALQTVLLADLIYVLALASLVLLRVVSLISARRARSAGSKLHLRLTRVFTLLALIPTVIVAVFAVITVNFGLEGWFSTRIQNVLSTSLSAAQAYEDEHRQDLRQDALALARFLNSNRLSVGYMPDGVVREVLAQGHSQIQRGLREAFVVDGTGVIRARGERSYLFDYEQPSEEDFILAREEGILIIEDWNNNEFRALVPLDAFVDRYLYVSRIVDGEILNLLDDTKATVSLYEQLESDRGRLLFEFGLIYLGFAVILVLAAIWAGLWFAQQLARPVGRLAGAVQRVGEGDLNVRVPEEKGDDEIAVLGRYFNTMTQDLKAQRQRLLESTEQVERRRRLFDSVLSSVTSGVVGLDAQGQVDFANRSAERLLDLTGHGDHPRLEFLVPEFAPMFQSLVDENRQVIQGEIKVTRNGKLENLLVRMAQRGSTEAGLEGYVIAFDDVTDLVSAQRMAAWGDVARRIAHEIKNPLTPIQLSAERIKRKFAAKLGEESEQLGQLTEVIVRQTNDLRRIVDEFSKFARMPEPEKAIVSLNDLIEDAVLIREDGGDDIRFETDLPEHEIKADVDPTMMSQVLTNLLKNAGEAIETYKLSSGIDSFQGCIKVALKEESDAGIVISISDNGKGLPEDRSKLFEPYYTTRAEGTGLGLPIVKKIVEDHGGQLSLETAEPFDESGHTGAMAIIHLPSSKIEADEAKNNE